MKTFPILLLAMLMVLAFAQTAQAQYTPYEVTCTEVGPKLTTPSDSIGEAIDTVSLNLQLEAISADYERIQLDRIELKLLREEKALREKQALYMDIKKKAATACDE